MPNWKTHIEIGIRINEVLKYNKSDLNLFLFGSILPDINNGYLITDVSNKIEHDITHMGKFINSSYTDFYNKYKKEIENRNPIFLGYLFHLYTDNTWNKNFYIRVQTENIKVENFDDLRIIKQSDFKVYNNNFINNIIEIDNIDYLLNEIKNIEEVVIEKEDILKALKFLKEQEIYNEKFKFYSLEELDNIINETINDCKKIIKL
ncbi:MAG: zinc dependent phospholipase C family protein [Clostridia bacterium]|nr:zinc dependent phospholipase C family protein [Clostridia bacterium]